MATRELLYWLAAACVVYPYLLYPAWLAWRVRRAARPVRRVEGATLPGVSVLLAARNEAGAIERRLAEFQDRIIAERLDGEIVVVSDGSTDETEAVVRGFAATSATVPVRLVVLAENRGKASALTAGAAEATREVLVLGDARQTWAPDALRRLLENFSDLAVGAVSGELFVESTPGVMAGVGLYWKIEKWLRKQESALHSTVGVTGAIAAVRRALFVPIPPGTVLDDVYWPLHVVAARSRVVLDGRAHAFDRLPDTVPAEFRRKVRTLAGNFQLVARSPWLLWPGCNPVWLALVSHKLMRLVVPWALLAMLGLSATIGGPLYGTLGVCEAGVMLLGVAGLIPAMGTRSRLAAAGGSFLVLNAAAFLGFWVWATGRGARSWTPTAYSPPPATLQGAAR